MNVATVTWKKNEFRNLIFDINNWKTFVTQFHDMSMTTGEDFPKADPLFKAIDSTLNKDEVEWYSNIK